MRVLRALLFSVFAFYAAPALADPFTVVLSSNGDTRTYSYNNVEDAIDTFSNSSLQQLLPSYTNGSAATALVNLRGLPATLRYPGAGTTLVLDVPSINLTRTFTGATRDDSQDLLVDFFKGQEGNDALTQILQQLAASTPIDPVAGNPNSLVSRMGDRDFARGTDYREGFNMSAAQSDGRNDFGIAADAGFFGTSVADQTIYEGQLTYTHRLPSQNLALMFDLPVMYSESEGATAYSASLGAGLRIPVHKRWALTPALRIGAIGSEDLGAAAVVYSGSITSDYRIPLTNVDEFQIGNMIGYYKTDGITVGDYNIDYDLGNTRLKNGVALNHRFANHPNALTAQVAFNDSRFFGDELFNDSYEEIGVSLIQPFNSINSVSIGTSYLFADDYDGVRFNVDVHF